MTTIDPSAVLAVTPEQVEAGARATYERSTPASLVAWVDAPDHVRKAHRINVRTALAAMGIPVVDGE